jgi:hypothetical protein
MEQWHGTIKRLVDALDGSTIIKSIQDTSDRKRESGGVDGTMERGTFGGGRRRFALLIGIKCDIGIADYMFLMAFGKGLLLCHLERNRLK